MTVFRTVIHYGDPSDKPIICLHGSGGGTKFAELLAKRWGVHAVCPIAMSGRAWLTDAQMMGLALPGGNKQPAVQRLLEEVGNLMNEYNSTWVAGHSQGACIAAEGRKVWDAKGIAMSCGLALGVFAEPDRYAAGTKMYVGWHTHDPVYCRIFGSTLPLVWAANRMQAITTNDDRTSHAPIWPEEAKAAFI